LIFKISVKISGGESGAANDVDMDGNSRGSSGFWDIGAYEYVSGTPSPPDTTLPPRRQMSLFSDQILNPKS